MYCELLIIVILSTKSLMEKAENPLNGKHLRVLPKPIIGTLRLTYNETGEFVDTSDGSGTLPLLIEWLSQRFNFTFSYTKSYCSPEERNIGLAMGLAGVECGPALDADIYLGVLVPLYSRFHAIDFSSSFTRSDYGILIPIPKPVTNLAAAVSPFQFKVWIFMILTIVITIFCTNLSSALLSKKMHQEKVHFSLTRTVDYLAKTFFSHGVFCRSKNTPVRLILAAWALFTFVMVQSYNTTLISFVTSPNFKPIIKSIRDIPNVPKYKVTVQKGLGADMMFSDATAGLYKDIGDMLRANPSNRCGLPQDCFDKVKSGNHFFVEVKQILDFLILEDRKKTGICSAMIAETYFNTINFIVGIRKNSQYTATINKGIRELNAAGLYSFWESKNLPFSKECQNKLKEKTPYPRLTMENLLGVFIILGGGILVSFCSLLWENIVYRTQKVVSSN